jgi:hypothetical protein
VASRRALNKCKFIIQLKECNQDGKDGQYYGCMNYIARIGCAQSLLSKIAAHCDWIAGRFYLSLAVCIAVLIVIASVSRTGT